MLFKKISFIVIILTTSSCTFRTPMLLSYNDDSNNTKTGKSCNKFIFGFPVDGDKSFYTAAKNGGISKINYADNEYFIAPFYYSSCTIVTGH